MRRLLALTVAAVVLSATAACSAGRSGSDPADGPGGSSPAPAGGAGAGTPGGTGRRGRQDDRGDGEGEQTTHSSSP
ncbi:hypothetical protein AB0C00_30690, partial [Micromonospora carbonacea]